MIKTILVDCDDVLVNLVAEWIEELNEIYNTSYKAEDVPDWNFTGMFEGVNKNDLLKPLHKAKIWKRVKPIEGAVQYLKALYDEGYEVFIVTATDYRNIRAKVENVVHKYFKFIDNKHIIVCYNKQLIGDENCVLVDDYDANLTNGKYNKILFNRPHNSYVDTENTDLHRVYSWKECYDYIHTL